MLKKIFNILNKLHPSILITIIALHAMLGFLFFQWVQENQGLIITWLTGLGITVLSIIIFKLIYRKHLEFLERVKSITTLKLLETFDKKSIKYLIKNNDTRIFELLWLSAQSGKTNIIKFLYKYNIDLEAEDEDGNTALILATKNNHLKTIKFLLDREVNINTYNNKKEYPITIASKNNNIEIIKELFHNDASIEVKDEDGLTPLAITALNGCLEAAEVLLKFNANPKAKVDGFSPIMLASYSGHLNVIKLFLEYKQGIESLTDDGQSILSIASMQGHDVLVKYFIRNNANILSQDDKGYSPILYAAQNNHIKVIKTLLETGVSIESKDHRGVSLLSVAIMNNHEDIVDFLINEGADINSQDNDGRTPLIYASIYANKSIINNLLQPKDSPLYKKVVQAFTLNGYDKIKLRLVDVEDRQIFLNLYYVNDKKQDIGWLNKKIELQKILGIDNISLEESNDRYKVSLYIDSTEANLIKDLKIDGIKPDFFRTFERRNRKYMFFKYIDGITLDAWYEKQIFIEDKLELPVEIELFDDSHELYEEVEFNEKMVIIKESNLSTVVKDLELEGKFLKKFNNKGYLEYYYKGIKYPFSWEKRKEEIIKYLNKRVSILHDENILILRESVEEAIPRILELEDSKKNYPELYHVQKDGDNTIYFYTFLPELNLNNWKEQARKFNFRTIFNEPNKVYKLDVYDKSNTKLYNPDFYENQLIILHELSNIPTKEELFDSSIIDSLETSQMFWGYGAGGEKYYNPINDISHMMIIGATGSGKSNLMNGLILSLLNSIQDIQKLYLIDLKSGIEFSRYKDLNSEKIEVFGKGTKPSRLLHALYEIEAEMYLREEYMADHKIVKIEQDPIFVIIDEFAQIELMYAQGKEKLIREEIFETLLRIGTRARSSNIKLIAQTQDPRAVPEELKKHLMSRVLLKTGKQLDREYTLQDPDLMDEYGINHVNFDKGRFVLEDYNDGDTLTNELQFPFIDPTKEYHLNFIEDANIISERHYKYDDFKEYIAKEYPFLANTNIISGVSALENEIIDVEPYIDDFKEEINIKDDEDIKDDFDFDSFLYEEETEEEKVENEISEINAIFEETNLMISEMEKYYE